MVFTPSAFTDGNEHPFSDRFPAVLLSSICSPWRDVVISTPDLWNTIPISVSSRMIPSSPRAHDNQMALVTLSLQRSLGYPALHIHLTGMFTQVDQTDVRALQAAEEHVHRWASLHIDTAQHLLPFLDNLRGRLSSLVSLTLDKSVKQAGASQIFVQALALRAFAFDHRAPRFFLPYPQLSILTLNTVYLPDMPIVLSQCHALLTLNVIGNLDGPFPYRAGPKDSSAVRLPSLERLVVNMEATRTDLYLLARLFGMLILPSLRDVQIMQDKTTSTTKWTPSEEFLKMLRRSRQDDMSAGATGRPNLQQLALINVPIPDVDLTSCLREIPHLRDLWIDSRTDGTVTDRLLELLALDEALTDTESDGNADEQTGEGASQAQLPPVPVLERLHVTCPASFSAESFMQMIRSRTVPRRNDPPLSNEFASTKALSVDGPAKITSETSPASPLRYINVHCTDSNLRVEPQITARMRIMAAAGVKLFFRVGELDVVHDDL